MANATKPQSQLYNQYQMIAEALKRMHRSQFFRLEDLAMNMSKRLADYEMDARITPATTLVRQSGDILLAEELAEYWQQVVWTVLNSDLDAVESFPHDSGDKRVDAGPGSAFPQALQHITKKLERDLDAHVCKISGATDPILGAQDRYRAKALCMICRQLKELHSSCIRNHSTMEELAKKLTGWESKHIPAKVKKLD